MTGHGEEDAPDDDDASTWHGLDEAQVRMHVRDLVLTLCSGEVEDGDRLTRQLVRLRQLVQEEIGAGMAPIVRRHLEYNDTGVRADAQRLADEVNRELAELGLSISRRGSGIPARLAVARDRPNESVSWLQLEPLDRANGGAPHRLPHPMFERIDLIPEPVRETANRRER